MGIFSKLFSKPEPIPEPKPEPVPKYEPTFHRGQHVKSIYGDVEMVVDFDKLVWRSLQDGTNRVIAEPTVKACWFNSHNILKWWFFDLDEVYAIDDK